MTAPDALTDPELNEVAWDLADLIDHENRGSVRRWRAWFTAVRAAQARRRHLHPPTGRLTALEQGRLALPDTDAERGDPVAAATPS